jgi:hypothetical protein
MSVQGRPPVNTNWSIDTSAKSIISFGADVLAATLSDNVQPLAYLACERYGATLAMCPESCAKVEILAKRQHTSHVLSRIGVSIGFAPNDVADKLASNEAGGKIMYASPKQRILIVTVRFLALAAALLSLGSPFKAAQCLHKLMDETSPERQLLPTVTQLKDLFIVLERKVSTAGFVDSLEVWDMILRSDELGLQEYFPISDAREDQPDLSTSSSTQPAIAENGKSLHFLTTIH